MLSVVARRLARQPIRIHPALWNLADECGGVAVCIVAYLGALALIAILAVHMWAELPSVLPSEPVFETGWSLADRSHPAFAVSQTDSLGKIEAYEIYRHPEGGRRDVLRWAVTPDAKLIAELELYRPGAEISQARPSADGIAARMHSDGTQEIGGEGIADSKFGPIALFGFADGNAKRCLGFIKNLEAANLRISGWSCQGESLPARRAAIGCILNRLVLLTARNDPKLAELFAQAELKRGNCASGSGAGALSADWVTGTQNLRLRGAI
jgi:hypothetical protein